MSGAVDLSQFGGQNEPSAQAGIAKVELTKENFQEVISASAQYPVVIQFWASWCEPCKQLSPIMLELTREYAGRFQLALVDIDAEKEIAQAFQVQSVPTVIAVVGGQAVPLFNGAQGKEQVRAVLEQLLQMCAQAGVTSRAPLVEENENQPNPSPVKPEHEKALAAEANGDLDTAISEWETVVKNYPRDVEATRALARLKVTKRAQSAQGSEDDPVIGANRLIAAGQSKAGFDLLLDAIAKTQGDEREGLRTAMIEALNASDDAAAVKDARRRLATLLLI